MAQLGHEGPGHGDAFPHEAAQLRDILPVLGGRPRLDETFEPVEGGDEELLDLVVEELCDPLPLPLFRADDFPGKRLQLRRLQLEGLLGLVPLHAGTEGGNPERKVVGELLEEGDLPLLEGGGALRIDGK